MWSKQSRCASRMQGSRLKAKTENVFFEAFKIFRQEHLCLKLRSQCWHWALVSSADLLCSKKNAEPHVLSTWAGNQVRLSTDASHLVRKIPCKLDFIEYQLSAAVEQQQSKWATSSSSLSQTRWLGLRCSHNTKTATCSNWQTSWDSAVAHTHKQSYAQIFQQRNNLSLCQQPFYRKKKTH